MAENYVGEIRMFAGTFAPAGWMLCQGQLLPIAEFSTLFNLIGTTYGGDGQQTFALPDLRGRFPVHMGNGFVIGQSSGQESVTLTASQLPVHSHAAKASAGGNVVSPNNAVWSTDPYGNTAAYTPPPSPVSSMAPNAINPSGGGGPHDNMQPFLPINFIIALFGIFPSQS
jgi:microcystin-dependent protein